MASTDSSTTIYIGNLKNSARLIELKANLLKLFQKSLKIQITGNDISIINGPKRYALVDVHHAQNVDFILNNIADYEDRKKIRYNFLLLVEQETWLYVDKVKSQDDKQASDDFENAKNPRPFQKPHRHTRKRPEYDIIIPLKTSESKSFRGGSRLSSSTFNSRDHNRATPKSYPSTDLDVTLPGEQSRSHNDDMGEVMNKSVDMIPLVDSTLKV